MGGWLEMEGRNERKLTTVLIPGTDFERKYLNKGNI